MLDKLTTKQKVLIGVGIVLLILAIIYIRKVLKERAEEKAADSGTIGVDARTPLVANDSFPLKRGKRGKRVEQLQMYLVRKYGASFPQWGVDGIWGDETEGNVQKFLKRDNVSQDFFNKLNVDGVLISSYVTNNFK
jgi:hypothetical protein